MARKMFQPTVVQPRPEQLELFELVERIKAGHEANVAAVLETGRLLLVAQVKVKAEGLGWIEWVEANLPFGARQAQSYLKVAKADAKRASHSDTSGRSLRASLRQLIAPADDAGGERKSRTADGTPKAKVRVIDGNAVVKRIAEECLDYFEGDGLEDHELKTRAIGFFHGALAGLWAADHPMSQAVKYAALNIQSDGYSLVRDLAEGSG